MRTGVRAGVGMFARAREFVRVCVHAQPEKPELHVCLYCHVCVSGLTFQEVFIAPYVRAFLEIFENS